MLICVKRWRIHHQSQLALVLLHQFAHWRTGRLSHLLPSETGKANTGWPDYPPAAAEARPPGRNVSHTFSHLPAACPPMGRKQVRVEQWPHHCSACYLWCSVARFRRSTSLNARNCHHLDSVGSAAQHCSGDMVCLLQRRVDDDHDIVSIRLWQLRVKADQRTSYIAIWFQVFQGVNAVQSGIHMLPLIISMVVGE